MGQQEESVLARAIERIENREAIRELMNQYCFIQDRGHTSHADEDIDAFLALCAPDFVWDNSADGSRAHRGPDAVRTYLRGLWRRFDSCMHFVHNLSIDLVSRERALGRSSFDAAGDIGGEAFVAAGSYVDEYVHTPAGWKFALHREVPFFFVKVSEGWAGPKPRIMREWARP
jgi:hypothetical protein